MRQNTANADIRLRVKKASITLWELAEKVGIADTTLTKWLRVELPADNPKRKQLEKALNEIESMKGAK